MFPQFINSSSIYGTILSVKEWLPNNKKQDFSCEKLRFKLEIGQNYNCSLKWDRVSCSVTEKNGIGILKEKNKNYKNVL